MDSIFGFKSGVDQNNTCYNRRGVKLKYIQSVKKLRRLYLVIRYQNNVF
ncbi:hypothetical protein LCDVSa122R [Lymphocystis disease virus 3]|uniref:Uncharacterized protein n=1 Tax=Lymphocystis disease virus 3 TaxID=2560566 RepID=A0A1B2RW49_9VIRU|nr:hypothetical protein BZK12_gp122 [Lymphocystis disease virus Sa]AOC55206.1 hypothetical protein LCDVSa122R [Lymphocystis disease virus 3]